MPASTPSSAPRGSIDSDEVGEEPLEGSRKRQRTGQQGPQKEASVDMDGKRKSKQRKGSQSRGGADSEMCDTDGSGGSPSGLLLNERSMSQPEPLTRGKTPGQLRHLNVLGLDSEDLNPSTMEAPLSKPGSVAVRRTGRARKAAAKQEGGDGEDG